jgi:hypothetical protein
MGDIKTYPDWQVLTTRSGARFILARQGMPSPMGCDMLRIASPEANKRSRGHTEELIQGQYAGIRIGEDKYSPQDVRKGMGIAYKHSGMTGFSSAITEIEDIVSPSRRAQEVETEYQMHMARIQMRKTKVK